MLLFQEHQAQPIRFVVLFYLFITHPKSIQASNEASHKEQYYPSPN